MILFGLVLGILLMSMKIWGWPGIIPGLVISVGGYALGFLLKRSQVMVPEMEVSLIYRRDRQSFVRFVPAGRHFINPLTEQATCTISTLPGVSEHTSVAATRDKIDVSIRFAIIFRVDPFLADPEQWPQLARTLPRVNSRNGMVVQKANQYLIRRLLAFPLDRLWHPGTLSRLETGLKCYLGSELATMGIEILDVTLGKPTLPETVANFFMESYQRIEQVRYDILIQQVLAQLADEDVRRHFQQEYIHLLGRSSLSSIYTLPSFESGPAAQPAQPAAPGAQPSSPRDPMRRGNGHGDFPLAQ